MTQPVVAYPLKDLLAFMSAAKPVHVLICERTVRQYSFEDTRVYAHRLE